MILEIDNIDDATQFATVWQLVEDEHGAESRRAVATAQRRRVYEKGPAWRIYDTDGQLMGRVWMARDYGWLHDRIVRIVRADLASREA